MIYAAILAGGKGTRVERFSIPKQFVPIGGTPVIVHTLKTFIRNSRFAAIYIAVHKDWLSYAENIIREYFSDSEQSLRIKLVCGGKERLDSLFNIISDIQSVHGIRDDDILLCHDAVRPFVTDKIINECIDATQQFGQSLTVIPTTDTIFKKNGDFLAGTYNREEMRNGQTPSGFTIKTLLKAASRFSASELSHVTGTMQILVNAGLKIKPASGSTANFKITTDTDFDMAETVLSAQQETGEIQILDCTLRDGGIVLNFNFGNEAMQKIKGTCENSGVEYIECGYINSKKGSFKDRTCFDSFESVKTSFLYSGKQSHAKYLAMIDYGTFDFDSVPPRNDGGLDGIRLAFHKEYVDEAIRAGKKILSRGYALFIQPMVATRYAENEFIALIQKCNDELPAATAFYIVDSFGQMDSVALRKKIEIADRFVSPAMKIGFHAHNNRQLAFSNACALLECTARHSLILDSSILGMGKGAGNLNTELLIAELIRKDASRASQYNAIGIYSLIRDYFSKLQQDFPWGYSLDYYLSSLYGITPSYIQIFTKNPRVTTDVLIDLCKGIPEEKKYACDRVFAQNYLNARLEELKLSEGVQ